LASKIRLPTSIRREFAMFREIRGVFTTQHVDSRRSLPSASFPTSFRHVHTRTRTKDKRQNVHATHRKRAAHRDMHSKSVNIRVSIYFYQRRHETNNERQQESTSRDMQITTNSTAVLHAIIKRETVMRFAAKCGNYPSFE
jgi:hypothetical protein